MKVVVCGAGIAGLTAAWGFAHAGWDVVLLEKASGPREEGYMIDFFGPGFAVAEQMGLVSVLTELAYAVPQAVWVDAQGRRQATLDYARLQRAEKGRLLSLMRGDLERALYGALPSGIERRFSCSLSAIHPSADGVAVELAGGERLRADVLVGADGIHSEVRALAFGPEERYFRYLGYHTAAFIFNDASVEAALDRRVWMISVPGREVGLYAIRDGRIACFFVHATADPRRPGDPLAELGRVYGDLDWLVPATLAGGKAAAAIYYDQVAQIALDDWCRGRVVLVGDAAYAVSLLAGQGASLAMAGAYRLAESVGRSASIEQGLALYQRRLRPLVEKKQATGRRAAQWIVPRDRRHILMRNWSLKLARLPGVSRLIARSLVGDPERVVK